MEAFQRRKKPKQFQSKKWILDIDDQALIVVYQLAKQYCYLIALMIFFEQPCFELPFLSGLKMRIVLIFVLLFCTISDCKKPKPKCKCGLPTSKTRNDKIFRGQDALPYQYPWQIFMEIKTKKHVFQNGGVLVSNRHILTSAHVFYAKPLYKKRYVLKINQDDIFDLH